MRSLERSTSASAVVRRVAGGDCAQRATSKEEEWKNRVLVFPLGQNGFVWIPIGSGVVRMNNPHNAVTDTMDQLGMNNAVSSSVSIDPEVENRWIVRFESVPGALIRSYIEIEVIEEEDEEEPTVCVLQRHNVGFRAMNRLMDALVENLTPRLAEPLEPQRPRAGSPLRRT